MDLTFEKKSFYIKLDDFPKIKLTIGKLEAAI